jgi:hypothetical protein
VLALALGLAAGLGGAELALRLAGLPRFYAAHSSPPQFSNPIDLVDGVLMYKNLASTVIPFVYDGDPRGYFGPRCTVEHGTNSAGFRGAELAAPKSAGTFRIAFLGDSFTFGEGVRDADTFCEQAARLLQESCGPSAPRFEGLNFGVGGHNTTQSLYVLQRFALPAEPDLVVLGFVLNDAEPPLLRWNERQQRVVRRKVEDDFLEAAGQPRPPASPLYRLRTAQVAWRLLAGRRRTGHTVEHYRALYAPGAEGWSASRDALRAIAALCRERGIPCYVVCFPILLHLDQDYPFAELHAEVGRAAGAAGAVFVDLLPAFRGREAAELWVHPTDQHPNEVAHAIAARALVERLRADGAVACD